MDRLFNHADQVTAARSSSPALLAPTNGAAAQAETMLFDDDLDLQAKVVSTNGRCSTADLSPAHPPVASM